MGASGWEKVQSRRREKTGESWASRVKEAAARKGASPLKNDSIGFKAIWKALTAAGNTVDLFIAKRRNAIGRMFGFARFFGVKDVKGCEEALNGIWMKKLKLKANVAKFGRKEGKTNLRAPVEVPRKLKSVVVQKEMHGNGAYADILSGTGVGTKMNIPEPPHDVDSTPTVNIMLPHAVKEEMKKKLIGRLKDFAKLRGFQNSLAAEGWGNVACRYLGSFFVLLEFKEEMVAWDFMSKEKESWSQWFSSFVAWSADFRVQERITSISITGLPPQAWVPEAFSKVAKVWGEVLVPEQCHVSNWDIHKGKVILLTDSMEFINGKVEAIVDETKFPVWVKEEDYNPWFLNGVAETQSERSEEESEEEED
ncbi:hypothetical protein LXL04_031318 [Taraxacum kok-saghyz]